MSYVEWPIHQEFAGGEILELLGGITVMRMFAYLKKAIVKLIRFKTYNSPKLIEKNSHRSKISVHFISVTHF